MKSDNTGKFTVEDIRKDLEFISYNLDELKKVLKAYFEQKLECKRLIFPFWKATYLVDVSMDRVKITQRVRTVPIIHGVDYVVHVDSFKRGNIWRIQMKRGISNNAYLTTRDAAMYLIQESYNVVHGEYKNYASVEPDGILYTFNIDIDELKEFVENYKEL